MTLSGVSGPASFAALERLDAQGNSLLARPEQPAELGVGDERSRQVREKFQQFVAGTFYRTLLAQMRKTVVQGPLMNGGRAERIFRAQLDQTLADQFAQTHGGVFADKMFEQFVLRMSEPQAGPGT